MNHVRCEVSNSFMAAMVAAESTQWLSYSINDDYKIVIERIHRTTQRTYLGMKGEDLPGFFLNVSDGQVTLVDLWSPHTENSSEVLTLVVSNPRRVFDYE